MAEAVYDSPESQMTDHRPQLSLTYNTISRWSFTRINVVSYVPMFSRFYRVRSANRARYESTITVYFINFLRSHRKLSRTFVQFTHGFDGADQEIEDGLLQLDFVSAYRWQIG